MKIPDEVVHAADSLRESWRADEANQLIAEWARKEALREAADLLQSRSLSEAPNAAGALGFARARILDRMETTA
jgi:hypothetical protein